ncbi:MAG: polysaccharide biosynthesis tyrosine autokinase, partial [Candidatus Sericytochromatia bacterium]
GAAYARSVELAPEDGALLNNYGSWLCRNGRAAEADAMFVRALDDPFFRGKLEVLFNAGHCAQGAGDLAAADGYFRRALELEPRHAPSLLQMARLQSARGDNMRARAFVQRLEALGPLDATTLELAAAVEAGLGNATASSLSSIDTRLIDLDVDRKVAEEKLANARRHLEVTDPGLMLRMEKLSADRVYASLQASLAEGEAALTVKRTQFTDDAPEVQDAKAQLEKLRAAIQIRVKHVLGKGLGDHELVSSRTSSEERFLGDLVAAQTEIAQLNARGAALKASRGEYESRFSVLPAKDQQLAQLNRRKAAAEQTYEVFLKREQEMRITEAMNLGNVRMIEEATVASASASGYSRTVSLAALLGLIFGLGVALLIEFLDDRIRRPEEAENVLELPILGMLPWVEGREASRRRLVVLEDPRSPVTESYRALQTYTRPVEEADVRRQCFMLTSPGPKEGKSTVLANLAITSAQLGKRTLIVDTDLRAPSQHINFNRQNLMGIYDVVYEGCPLEEAIQQTDVEGLDILCTGPVPPDPVQTLHADAFKRMVEKLRKDYDAIFFDSPPINLFTDAAVLGRMTDSVLLVVDVRSTTRQATMAAKELLIKAKVPLAGMVVKNTAATTNRYHTRYYERYYMDRLKQLADE